ncbi:cell wall-binding repeat-containing protein [Herbiconiux sp. A18JL235]|uniref:Cell wall-binding repeat-containing protein n=1 Tax=Herbiconiux sp. A18JL235 TaxID=3152363 RepID=A0AB39BJF7_9MICO
MAPSSATPRRPRGAVIALSALAALTLPVLVPAAAHAELPGPLCPQQQALRGVALQPSPAVSEADPHAAASISAGSLPAGVVLAPDAPGSYAFSGIPSAEGDFSFTVRLARTDVPPATIDCTVSVSAAPAISRIQGSDRYDQAARVSKASFSSSELIYLANGEKFPDALSAGSVAGVHGAPLLLTQTGSLPTQTKTEIARLHPKNVVVVGGPLSVAQSVIDGIGRDFPGTTVTRVAGADRYSGSRALITHPVFGVPHSADIYLATGAGFPDALAASPAAITKNAPVLLIDGAKSTLSAEEYGVLASLSVTGIRIAGGTSSISTSIESTLWGGPWTVERQSGRDRYEGSVALNQVFTAAPTVYLASGTNFPDALSGGPAAGHGSSPIYLVQNDCVPPSVLRDIARVKAKKVVVLGGLGTLGKGVDALRSC